MAEADDEPWSEPERDPWFNPYRHPRSERGWKPYSTVQKDVEAHEERKRARKAKDSLWFWDVLTALVSDLTYDYLNGSPGKGLVVPRAKRDLGKKSRYYPPFFTRSFPVLLDQLERLGYLEQTKGAYSGLPGKSKRTTIRAGAALVALIKKHGVTFDDLALSDAEEVVILKRAKRGHWDKGERIEYEDTPTTIRLRKDLHTVNSILSGADISFDPSAYSLPVDVRARRLYRYFANADFKSGGRLFKGFWENLPKQVRLRGIRIDGERVVEIDYRQLNPTLAYAEVGCLPPPGDAYTLPGLKQYRDGVKKVFNALLFDRRSRKSFPEGVNVFFPPKTKVSDVISAIHEKHPMLRSALSTGIGFHLMFKESEIMMKVLKLLMADFIIGLPVFDAVIVKASEAEPVRATMKAAFKAATGLDIDVRLENS